MPDSRCVDSGHGRTRAPASAGGGDLAYPNHLRHDIQPMTTRARALAAGVGAFLYKPCREEDLLNAIEVALKHS
jgi:CheY-like chemotaxis protein